jgi:hypothetical protein
MGCIASNLAAGGVIAGNLAIEELATQQLETIYSIAGNEVVWGW